MLNMKCARLAGALALWFVGVAPVMAGPGHDHGEEAPQATGPASPRVSAVSDAFEFVGILKEGKLVIYLDRAADTAPVTGAKIEVTVGTETKLAAQNEDGTYEFVSPALEAHGDLEVIASIEHEGKSDLLVGVLKDPHDHGHEHGHGQGDDDHGAGKAHDHEHGGEAGKSEQGGVKPQSGLMPKFGSVTAALKTTSGMAAAGLIAGFLIAFTVRGRAGLLLGIAALMTVLGVGVVSAGPGHDHGEGASSAAAGDAPRRLPDGELFLPKPTQRLLSIRTRILNAETARSADRLIGRIIADPNRSGLVQSTIGGRIQAAAEGIPSLGQHVKKGQVLAYVEPAFAPIDASDVRQTAGDLAQRIAVLDARLARQKRLVNSGVANPASLEDLEIERQGLEARRHQLEKSRSEPEVLIAPVDGVIADVRIVAGQVVTTADTLFNILDPQSLWVEAIAFDAGLDLAGRKAKARLSDGALIDLTFMGRGRALQQQASVLQFKVEQAPEGLSIGSPVKVLIEKGEPVTGLIIPRSAVAQAPNGQLVAFKRLEPERYLPAAVRIEDIDGERVVVTAGLKPGDQIITVGASLVNQIR